MQQYSIRLTLSQSSLDLVIGRARRRPLKVFSLIAWYASFSVFWYLLSSLSMTAKSLAAEGAADDSVIAGGKASEMSCVVESCT